MKHVIVERTAHYSANVINYGPWNVEMRMKMLNKKDHPERSGIIVHFRKHSKLLVGDSAILQVTWHPTRERFSEKSTEVKHMIYIEVIFVQTKTQRIHELEILFTIPCRYYMDARFLSL